MRAAVALDLLAARRRTVGLLRRMGAEVVEADPSTFGPARASAYARIKSTRPAVAGVHRGPSRVETLVTPVHRTRRGDPRQRHHGPEGTRQYDADRRAATPMGRSHGVTNPSVRPATTRKMTTPSRTAPSCGTMAASASARVERPGSIRARAMARPPAPARAMHDSSSSPWGTTRRRNWSNAAAPPLERPEHPEQRAVVGQRVHRQDPEGEPAGDGHDGDLDVVGEDGHGQAASGRDGDPVEALPGCGRTRGCRPGGGPRPRPGRGGPTPRPVRRPHHHGGGDHQAPVLLTDAPPQAPAEELPGGLRPCRPGVDEGVGPDHQALEPLGPRGQGEGAAGQGQVGGRGPVELAQAEDLLGASCPARVPAGRPARPARPRHRSAR